MEELYRSSVLETAVQLVLLTLILPYTCTLPIPAVGADSEQHAVKSAVQAVSGVPGYTAKKTS